MSNKAAWSTAKGGAFNVDAAPMPQAQPGHIFVKNAAIALNPIDWKMHDLGIAVSAWPTILGCAVAGRVHEIGAGVEGFTKDQRVMGTCCRLVTGDNSQAAFQLYTSVVASLAAPIPDEMPFEEAVVAPLSVTTAAAGLYAEDKLAVPLPGTRPERSGRRLLVWGGSSSTGCAAIQLANASGLDVVATASERNFELVRSLDATAVFDHRSPTAVDNIVKELAGKSIVGCFDCIGSPDTTKACFAVLSQLRGQSFASVGMLESLPSGIQGGTGVYTFLPRTRAR